jgi:outer membrane protein with beta-barrel domain
MRLPMVVIAAYFIAAPALALAQERGWVAEVTLGWAGFVDDATQNYLLAGASVRRHLTPRVSIGPEFVVMSKSDAVRDRNLMLTGNVVFDAYRLTGPDARRVTPFVVGGAGLFWGRDQVRNGPFWFSDPAFTAGGGVRARFNERVSAAAEYRIGWELHQRVSASAGFHW